MADIVNVSPNSPLGQEIKNIGVQIQNAMAALVKIDGPRAQAIGQQDGDEVMMAKFGTDSAQEAQWLSDRIAAVAAGWTGDPSTVTLLQLKELVDALFYTSS